MRANTLTSSSRASSAIRLSPALSHPLWWGALLLLAVNDHVLKGSGWLPGWLTGKLSDFAFLLVAPALVQTCLPLVRARRSVAMLAVVIPFVLAKLLPGCTGLLESTVRAVGIPWTLWTDPTDVIAVAVLPVTWRLMTRDLVRASESLISREVLSRAGVALGAAACIATSAVHATQVRPFVFNASGAERTVEVRWLLKASPCSTPFRELATSLQNGDMSQPVAIQLDVNKFSAIDLPPIAGASPVGVCSNDVRSDSTFDPVPGFCAVALLQVDGAPTLLTRTSGIVGDGNDDVGICVPMVTPDEHLAGEVRLEPDAKSGLRWTVGPHVESMEFAIPSSWASDAPSVGSCGAIAMKYEQDLQAAQSCTADQDCRPVAMEACEAVNANVADPVDADLSSYAASGCSLLPQVCRFKPAICDAGRCAVDCPMVDVDSCPRLCPGTRTGDAWLYPPCLNDQGDLCSADENGRVFVCARPPAPPAGCRNWCWPPSR